MSRESRAVSRGSARRRKQSKEKDPPNMSDLRIALLGKSVSENSRVGNFILGRSAFDSEAPPDVVERVGGRLKDRRVMVINSPQLLHTHISDHQITQTVRECVYLSDPGPHAFILVLQNKDFTEEDMRRVKQVLEKFSEEAIKRTIVITTDEDKLRAKGASVKSNEFIQQLTKECGGGHLQLDHEIQTQFSGILSQLEKILRENSEDFLTCEPCHDAEETQDEDLSRTFASLRTVDDGGVSATRQQKLNVVLCGSDETLKNSVSKLISKKKDVDLQGRVISLVELPALFNTRLSEEEVMRQTLRCVSLCDPGVHVFLLIIPDSLNNEDKAEMEEIQRIFSSRINKHMMILIMQNSEHQTEELNEETQSVIERFGGRHHFFGPTTRVSTLMENIEQMLEENRGEFFSTETFREAQMKKTLKYESLETPFQLQGSREDPDELRIVLLGKTGVGKSSTGNTILGRNAFTAEISQESVTKESQRETSDINGRHVTVIDTPGLFDTELTNEEIQREIRHCISMILPGPHVFIIVLNLGQRFTREEETSVKIIQETFDEKSLMFTMVLFTRGDDLKDKTIDQYLRKPGSPLMNLIEACGNRYHVFNNNQTGDRTQVSDLLEKIDHMVNANGGSFYSCKMFREMEREKQEQQMKILMDRVRETEEEKERIKMMMEEERQNHDEERKRREEELKREIREQEKHQREIRDEMRRERETFKHEIEEIRQEKENVKKEKENLQIRYDTEIHRLMNRIENERQNHDEERKRREEEFNARVEQYKTLMKEKEESEEKMREEMKRERETFKHEIEEMRREKEKIKTEKEQLQMEIDRLINRNYEERKKREEDIRERVEQYKRQIKEKEESEENMHEEMKREREEWEKQKLEEKKRREEENEKRREKEQRVCDEFNERLKEEKERMMMMMVEERQNHDEERKRREEELKREIREQEERQREIRDEMRRERETFKHEIEEIRQEKEKITTEKEKVKTEYEKKRRQWQKEEQDERQKREEEKKKEQQKSELHKKQQRNKPDHTKTCGTEMEGANMMFNQHLNLVLLGRTGVGKSASGNTILGRQAFRSKKSSRSVTRDVSVESGTVDGFPVTVYDTPELFNTDMREEEIHQMINVKVLQRCESGPCVFLLVIKAERFTGEERKTVEKIEELLGEERLKKTWILFTGGDQLEEENMTIKEFIDEIEPLKKLVQKYDQRYCVFNNIKRRNTEQVKMLLMKILLSRIDIQEGEVADTLKSLSPVSSLSSRRIVLLGKTGVGKSSSGNTILGQREFDSEISWSSVTSECSDAHATVSGRSVSVVDTPGLFDTQMRHEELMTEIVRSMYLSSPGPHAFLIVFRVDRFTDQEQQIPQMIEMMFGEGVLKYSIILFTHGDLLEDGKSVEELIERYSILRDLVDQCGGRYHVFNNIDENNRDQVNDLLKKIDTMIEQNGGGHYSNQMIEDAQRFRQEERERKQNNGCVCS